MINDNKEVTFLSRSEAKTFPFLVESYPSVWDIFNLFLEHNSIWIFNLDGNPPNDIIVNKFLLVEAIIVYQLLSTIYSLEIFTSALADDLSQEFEWQQVSSSLQDSSQYYGRSK